MSFFCFTTNCVLVLAFLVSSFVKSPYTCLYMFVVKLKTVLGLPWEYFQILNLLPGHCTLLPFHSTPTSLCTPAITLWTREKSWRQSLTPLYVHMKRAKSYNWDDSVQYSNLHNIHLQNHKSEPDKALPHKWGIRTCLKSLIGWICINYTSLTVMVIATQFDRATSTWFSISQANFLASSSRLVGKKGNNSHCITTFPPHGLLTKVLKAFTLMDFARNRMPLPFHSNAGINRRFWTSTAVTPCTKTAK